MPIRPLFAVAAALFALQSAPAFGDPTGPLRIRNTAPLAGLYGLPRTYGAEVVSSGAEWSLQTDYGSNFSRSADASSEIFLDGETAVYSAAMRFSIGERFELGAEVPYITHRGGRLDGFIDEFHEVFGFPEGGRELAERNRLDYLVRVDGVTYADFERATEGWGDPRLWLGWQWRKNESRASALRAQVKFPNGDVADLTGSEAVDVAIWLEHAEYALFGQPKLGLNLMFGGLWLGDGELAPRDQRRVAALASLGLRYRLFPALEVHLQADAHTAAVDTRLGELRDDTVQGTIGGRWLINPSTWLDLAVVENLTSRTAPDAVFLIHLHRRL